MLYYILIVCNNLIVYLKWERKMDVKQYCIIRSEYEGRSRFPVDITGLETKSQFDARVKKLNENQQNPSVRFVVCEGTFADVMQQAAADGV